MVGTDKEMQVGGFGIPKCHWDRIFPQFFALGQRNVVQYLTGIATGNYATVPVGQYIIQNSWVSDDVTRKICHYDGARSRINTLERM